MPVSSTSGPSGCGGEGQLMPGGAVGARPGPRPAAAGAGCCASTAIPVSTNVKANTRTRIESFSLNAGSHYMPDRYCSSFRGIFSMAIDDTAQRWQLPNGDDTGPESSYRRALPLPGNT